MKMLQQLLKANGINWNEAKLKSYLNELEADPDNLSDTEIQAIAQDIISANEKVGLTTAPTMAPAKGKKGRMSRANRTERAIDDGTGIQNAMQQAAMESKGIIDGVEAVTQQAARVGAEQMLDIVADMPVQMLSHFERLAADHRGNPEFFRSRGEAIARRIFAFAVADEAE